MGKILTDQQVGVMWILAGGPPSQVIAAMAIADAESTNKPDAVAGNTINGSHPTGLFQIVPSDHESDARQAGWKGSPALATWLTNGWNNTKTAVVIYKHSGWKPWSDAATNKKSPDYAGLWYSAAYADAYGPNGPQPNAVQTAVKNLSPEQKATIEQGNAGAINVGATANQIYSGGTASGGVPSAVSNPMSSIAGALSKVVDALGTLTSASTWLRIGAILGAVLLVVVGVVFMVESNKDARHATELAAVA